MNPVFDYDEKSIGVDGTRIRYWDEGTGPALLLLHGIAASKEFWGWFVPQWVDRFRVVAIDLPGYGASDIPAKPFKDLAYASQFLKWVMDGLGIDKPILIGHSMGSGIAVQYALTYPGSYRGLVLMSSMGFGKEIDWLSKVLVIPGVGELLFHPTESMILDFLRGEQAVDGLEKLAAITHRSLKRPNALRWHLSLMREGISLRGQKVQFNAQDLAQINVPSLIIHGEDDPMFPIAHAQLAANLIPESELHLIPGAKHNPHIEYPVEVFDLITAYLNRMA